jgi:hypothetical protein
VIRVSIESLRIPLDSPIQAYVIRFVKTHLFAIEISGTIQASIVNYIQKVRKQRPASEMKRDF